MPRRRAEPLPEPPLLRAIAVDGSNVAASATAGAMRRIASCVAWCRQWRPDLPVCVFLDYATPGRWPAAVREELQWQRASAPAGVQWRMSEPGVAVDAALLQHAVAEAALVVSNDRWFDHEASRLGVISVQFECDADGFVPHAEATWFTPSGGAMRLSMAELRERRDA